MKTTCLRCTTTTRALCILSVSVLASSLPSTVVSPGALHPESLVVVDTQLRRQYHRHKHHHALRRKHRRERSDEVLCVDTPAAWKSDSGATCDHYAEREWCTEDGGFGPGWNKDWGTFKAWSTGTPADVACCACGGGSEVIAKIGEAGIAQCSEGSLIEDEDLCKEAAEFVGASFAMTAMWPLGQPPGCHADAAGKTVWFNMHREGTVRAEYAPLCAIEVDAGGDAAPEGALRVAPMVKQASSIKDKEKDVQEDNAQDEEQTKEDKAKLEDAVVQAHRKLAYNLKRRVEIGISLHHMKDHESSDREIDEKAEAVANETHSPAIADFLASMWKEMRMMEGPVYEEHLKQEFNTLEKVVPELQADYDEKKIALDNIGKSA